MSAANFAIRLVVLAPATAAVVSPAGKTLRGIANIGTNSATLGSSSSVVAGSGWPLSAAATAGDMGGGLTFEGGALGQADLYAISTAGTTLAVLEG